MTASVSRITSTLRSAATEDGLRRTGITPPNFSFQLSAFQLFPVGTGSLAKVPRVARFRRTVG